MMTANQQNRPEHDQDEQRSRRHLRIRRTKRLLRPLPRKANLHRWPVIKWFAKYARKQPYLWSFRVAQVSPAIYIGCILALLPAYGLQLILAFLAALFFRANLLVLTGLQFITNPATVWFIYPLNFVVGREFIELANLGEVKSKVGYAYATVLGGLIVGLLCAIALDIVYRVIASKAANRSVNVKRMLKS